MRSSEIMLRASNRIPLFTPHCFNIAPQTQKQISFFGSAPQPWWGDFLIATLSRKRFSNNNCFDYKYRVAASGIVAGFYFQSHVMNIKGINIAQTICLISQKKLRIVTKPESGDERDPNGELNKAYHESLLCSFALVTNNTARNLSSHFVNVPLTVFLSTHVKMFERSQFKVISDLLR